MSEEGNKGGHVINYIIDGNMTYAFDVSQFCTNFEYGINMHSGIDFNEVASEAVKAYGDNSRGQMIERKDCSIRI